MLTQWEDRAAELQFDVRASNITSAFQNGLDQYFGKVAALQALFESSPDGVTRSQFDTFASRLLQGQTAILSVSWIPRIVDADRAEHEREGQREGIAGYHIRAVDEHGQLVISPTDEEYFPVFYTAYAQAGVLPQSVYGLDLGDSGKRQQPLDRARDTDQAGASSVIGLQSGVGDRNGFFVVLPVYKQGLRHATLEDRRRNLSGFVQAVFQTSVMAQSILAGISAPIDLYVFPEEDAPFSLSLLDHRPDRYSSVVAAHSRYRLTKDTHWDGVFAVADRTWTVIAAPASDVPLNGRASAWTFLAAGLLITGGASCWMWRSARYVRRISESNAHVLQLAYTDALTSLANRRALFERLAIAFAASQESGRPFAMLYLDLDHFKDVNDTLGHSTGDAILNEAAKRIRATLGEADFAARIGGDEFAVLQTDASNRAASCMLAARLIESLAQPYPMEGTNIRLTVSVGVAFWTQSLAQPETIMMQADLSLYRAKEDGRNCFRCHNEVLDTQVQDRVLLGENLRGAIMRGELELYYQPQVEILSGRIVGLEALVRWNHPARGLVPPSLFIPIAERTGVIVLLGRWVFDQACRQTKQWHREGIAPPIVAVNVSAVQCKQSDFEHDLAQSLSRWGVDPGAMELELTESVLMDGTQEHRDIVERLRRLGVRIAIDDFGTGYSSLSYLANYPVDRLKIAQQLIFGVESDPRHASVARMAIHLSREIGVEVIAEGVENDAQARFLVAAGCLCAQGYYFSKPVTAERATELLRERIIWPAKKRVETEGVAVI
jgi:diguanylate cyclase (GGDEF)-like protein